MLKNILLAAAFAAMIPSPAFADDDTDETAAPADDGGYATTPTVDGDTVVDTAARVAGEYDDKEITYPDPDVRPLPAGTADCNSYVHDVLNQSGIDVPETSTRDLENNPNFARVDGDDAQPGDVIWQTGHMGIYSGDDEDGDPQGWQMGTSGPAEQTWGPDGAFKGGNDTRYYRPAQTADLEQRIGEQIDELSATPPSVGEDDSSDDDTGDDSGGDADVTFDPQGSAPAPTYYAPAPTYHAPAPTAPSGSSSRTSSCTSRGPCAGRAL